MAFVLLLHCIPVKQFKVKKAIIMNDLRKDDVEHFPQEAIVPQRRLSHLTHSSQQTRLAVHAKPAPPTTCSQVNVKMTITL